MSFWKKKNKISLIILILFTIFGFFYWFQIRPAQIKHDCSWVKVVEKAIPAQPGISEAELLEKGIIKDCSILPTAPPEARLTLLNRYRAGCELNNREIIDKNMAKPAVPAKEWWRKATENEYRFCLHDKGL